MLLKKQFRALGVHEREVIRYFSSWVDLESLNAITTHKLKLLITSKSFIKIERFQTFQVYKSKEPISNVYYFKMIFKEVSWAA